MVHKTSSVVVVDIDGLSIRSAGCYGNVEKQTPLLDEFASQSRLFEQHYRAFVDSQADRDAAFLALVQSVSGDGLMLANTETPSRHDVTVFSSDDELLDILEEDFDSEDCVAWIRIVPPGETLDEAVPLGLITKLVEAGVSVVLTSCTPVLDGSLCRVGNEECIRVPLMVWSLEPYRLQSITSSVELGCVLTDSVEAGSFAVMQDPDAVGLRERNGMLVATRELLASLEGVPDEQLSGLVDVTDERLQMFKKPEDVWNVHNALVEDLDRAIEALVRLRNAIVVPAVGT